MSQARLSKSTGVRSERAGPPILVRALRESDLPDAETIVRYAFGTFRGISNLQTYATDREFVWSRWQADPTCAFAAECEGQLAGTNFGVRWGTVGFFGPLAIRPALWDRGIGQHLIEPVVARLEALEVRHIGLYTFAESSKHVNLYQKFGFWPRFLTAYMSLPVTRQPVALRWSRYSAASEQERAHHLELSRALSEELYDGLDLRSAIRSGVDQAVGDTVFLWDGDRLVGFAIGRFGPRSEAGAGACLIKFGAVRAGPNAARHFDQLLNGCACMAADVDLSRLWVGINTSRYGAYRQLLARGFRTEIQGVTMHRPNESGYDRDDAYIIDDWR
jgi:GNAT superfamily N-acetyltransferase